MTSVAAAEGRPTATGVCLSQIRHVVAAGAEWSSPVGPGLSLGLVANGDLDFRLPAERFQRFNGPLGFLTKRVGRASMLIRTTKSMIEL